MPNNEPNCACLHVVYSPIDVIYEGGPTSPSKPDPTEIPPKTGDTLKRDSWSCRSCGARFIRTVPNIVCQTCAGPLVLVPGSYPHTEQRVCCPRCCLDFVEDAIERTRDK